MDKRVFCIECNKFFDDVESFNKEHDQVSYKVMNVKHNFLLQENCLEYIIKLISVNNKIIDSVNKQNLLIQQISSKLNYYEDSLKNDIFFECNVNIKNIENKINGKCLIHFFPKCIHFRIECKGDIIFTNKKEFIIEILFPFQKSNLKFSSIEKLQGCISSYKVLNTSEQETIVYNNYSSLIEQNNYITSIKLLRNYFVTGYFEKKKIDISINGILTFSSFKFDLNLPFILFLIEEKKFLCYEQYQWKFIDNCFTNEGNINENCIVYLEINFEQNEIYIKNKYKYLGNKPDFITSDKKNGKFNFNFLNQFYGIISIFNEGKYLSSSIQNLINLSNEQNNFLIYNI
jgi:hypothetical protein